MMQAVQTDKTVIMPFNTPPHLAQSRQPSIEEASARPVHAEVESLTPAGVEGQGEGEWYWEEQYLRGSLGFVVEDVSTTATIAAYR
jgi:hypothetical protein